MEDTKWVKWEPKVGEVPPEGCQYDYKDTQNDWTDWDDAGPIDDPVTACHLELFTFRIPAPTVREVRPPWIDPQCKFRWGDRVMDDTGDVFYVINPNDPTNEIWPVLVATTLTATYPYAKRGDVGYGDSRINAYMEKALALYPEDLPKHYDDTQQPVKEPVECWVVVDATGQVLSSHVRPTVYPTKEAAESWWEGENVTIHHMREVL